MQCAIPDHVYDSGKDVALEGASPREAVFTQPVAPRNDLAVVPTKCQGIELGQRFVVNLESVRISVA